jgi:hypothetical protein
MGAIGLSYTRDPKDEPGPLPVKAQGPLLKFVQRLQELDLSCLRSGPEGCRLQPMVGGYRVGG